MSNAELKSYITDVSRYPLLNREQEGELSKRSLAGDDRARQILISSNLRLVIKIAYSYSRKQELLQDIIQEGNIGLITAAGKFDYRKNVRFSTYSTFWIRQNMTRYILSNSIIRLPALKELNLRRVQSFIDDYQTRNSQFPDLEEIGRQFGLSRKELLSFWDYRGPIMSLSQPIDKYYLVGDTISDRRFSPEKMLLLRSMKEELSEALSVLTDRERRIIQQRFSLNKKKRETLKSIGKCFGITSEAVRLIEKKALEKLRLQSEDLKILYRELQHGIESTPR